MKQDTLGNRSQQLALHLSKRKNKMQQLEITTW